MGQNSALTASEHCSKQTALPGDRKVTDREGATKERLKKADDARSVISSSLSPSARN